MRRVVLVVNAGSSSLKFAVFGARRDGGLVPALQGEVDGIGARPRVAIRDAAGRILVDRPVSSGMPRDHHGAISEVGGWLRANADGAVPIAVGHRVVHGGERYARAVLIDDAVVADLERLVPLAPLHQPHHLAAIEAIRASLPDVPQVACFDTAFHLTQPPLARAFALPRRYAAEGVRRFGFHGLSYEYVAAALPRIAPEAAGGRVVVAHLGNGASLCAMHGGRSVATTMGFTALDGLVMGTRCGAIDPGVLLYLKVDPPSRPSCARPGMGPCRRAGTPGTRLPRGGARAPRGPRASPEVPPANCTSHLQLPRRNDLAPQLHTAR